LEGEPVLGKETLDEGWPVLDTFEPVLDDRGDLVCVGGGHVAQAVFHVRPGALDGVEVGGVSGQSGLGQPVWVTLDEPAYGGAAVGVHFVPDQNDRGRQVLVRGGDQAGVIGFRHRAALTHQVKVQPVLETVWVPSGTT